MADSDKTPGDQENVQEASEDGWHARWKGRINGIGFTLIAIGVLIQFFYVVTRYRASAPYA